MTLATIGHDNYIRDFKYVFLSRRFLYFCGLIWHFCWSVDFGLGLCVECHSLGLVLKVQLIWGSLCFSPFRSNSLELISLCTYLCLCTSTCLFVCLCMYHLLSSSNHNQSSINYTYIYHLLLIYYLTIIYLYHHWLLSMHTLLLILIISPKRFYKWLAIREMRPKCKRTECIRLDTEISSPTCWT